MTNDDQRCPFFSPTTAVCAASLCSRIPPQAIRTSCCAGGDYETCSTFLARLLSSLRLRRR